MEQVRAFAWEARRCQCLAVCPPALRVVKGERFLTGQTPRVLDLAADAQKFFDRLAERVSDARLQRISEWVNGKSLYDFGQVEQMQLKIDVSALRELVVAGGYAYMFHGVNIERG